MKPAAAGGRAREAGSAQRPGAGPRSQDPPEIPPEIPPESAPGTPPESGPASRPGPARGADPRDGAGPDPGFGRVLCFGAAHWDLIGRPALDVVGRIEPGDDAPGAIETRPGGVALNIAFALSGMRRHAVLVAPIGEDPGGIALMARLRDAGVGCRRIVTGAATGRYLAIESAAGALIAAIADLPGCDAVTPDALAPHLDVDAAAWVIEANLPALALDAISRAPRRPLLAANPASPAKAVRLRPLLGRIDLLYCNLCEAAAICGADHGNAAAAVAALAARGVREPVVTDGPRPAATLDAGGAIVTMTPPASRGRSVTGAGDALLAAHLHARLAGASPRRALTEGLAAALDILEDKP